MQSCEQMWTWCEINSETMRGRMIYIITIPLLLDDKYVDLAKCPSIILNDDYVDWLSVRW